MYCLIVKICLFCNPAFRSNSCKYELNSKPRLLNSCSETSCDHLSDNNITDVDTAAGSSSSCSSSSTNIVVVAQNTKNLRFGNSMESSDIGDSISDETTSFTSSSCPTRRLSSNSSNYSSHKNRSLDSIEEFIQQQHQPQQRHHKNQQHNLSSTTSNVSNGEGNDPTSNTRPPLSNSSSQESLPSDQQSANQPASLPYHQYYHVFREGELEQLLGKYVENLHVIQSYYDHASWCIVAEKVQVWTIWLIV